MAAYRLTPDALADLEEIVEFIANDNPEAADRVRHAICAACESLSKHPSQGVLRPELTNGKYASGRFVSFGKLA